ncbi:hypothetical protein DRQ25_14515 [Candidatus Fermentibacteria bacterium]|nr:MAG: hypothetical protein DRQ25_14515 [Candidatus Fermentibacteria bacterium]
MAKAEAVNVDTAGNTKRSKAAASADAPAKDNKAPKVEGEKGAPRPRKHDYGIQGENVVAIVPRTEEEGEPKLKAKEAEGYESAKTGPTVETFLASGERAILRRLSRKGLITITAPDGTVYPKDYVAPPKPAPKPKAEKQEAGDTKAA